MNDLEYLNQIAAVNRPVKQPFSIKKIFQSKLFKIVVGFFTALIFILVLAGLISSVSRKEHDLLSRINVRMTNLSFTINQYNFHAKSSALRGIGSSLGTVLSESNKNLYGVLLSDYNESATTSSTPPEETAHSAELTSALEDARLNGLFDRVYRQKLIYEISLLISLENEALERTGNSSITSILTKSVADLTQLSSQLSAYSDSTN